VGEVWGGEGGCAQSKSPRIDVQVVSSETHNMRDAQSVSDAHRACKT
jgi:hypothetical protein